MDYPVYDELMNNKNMKALDEMIALRNANIAAKNAKAAKIAKKNLSACPLNR